MNLPVGLLKFSVRFATNFLKFLRQSVVWCYSLSTSVCSVVFTLFRHTEVFLCITTINLEKMSHHEEYSLRNEETLVDSTGVELISREKDS